MQRQHVAQIAALEAACFSDPWSEGSVAAELDNPPVVLAGLPAGR